MSKDKDTSIHTKLKNWFRINKGAAIPRSRSDEYVILSEELEAELKNNQPIATRLKGVRELGEICKTRRAECHTIEKIWTLLNDLLRPDVPKEARHQILGLFATLCQCQLEKSGFLRAKFFAFIKSHEVIEDAGPRFNFLTALTENGRDVSYFDEKIGPLILAWVANPEIHSPRTKEFMSFLVNIIKFNQSFLDQDVLGGIIHNVCYINLTTTVKDSMLDCLLVLEAVICYASLPPGSLSTFLSTLCRTVNVDALCPTSWKIMRQLLGTHFGPSGLFTMCSFMESGIHREDAAVIRGAVFFVGSVLWGARIIRNLKYSANTVLSSFVHALELQHPMIIYEVTLRVQDLIRCNGDCLQTVSWDLIFQILTNIIELCQEYFESEPESNNGNSNMAHFQKIIHAVNETLDAIEVIVDKGDFPGSLERYYNVQDVGYLFRPEPSVIKLLQYKVQTQLLSMRQNWFSSLVLFTETHYNCETRTGLRVKALGLICNVCLVYRDLHEDELLDKIIIPNLKNLDCDTDPLIRQNGVKFIVDFMMESTSKKGHDLLHVLERIVNKPYEVQAQAVDTVHIFTESEVIDVFAAVDGLVQLFQRKIYTLPSSLAVAAYKILVRHLHTHYKKPAVLEHCYAIRYKIFECFFRIRANSMFHLGFPEKSKTVVTTYSPYLAVDHRDGEKFDSENGMLTPSSGSFSGQPVQSQQSQAPPPTTPPSSSPQSTSTPTSTTPTPPAPVPTGPPSPTFLSLTLACKLVVSSLKKEKDWKVLELVLLQIPHVMENKALILSKHGNDIDYLATALCAMVADKSLQLPETLRNWPSKFVKSDFHAYLFPILTSLVSYHCHIESSVQLKIVKCLEMGLVTKCSRTCILSLSVCTLEMKDTMHKLLPEVLLALSKISPKAAIAIPVLEFLSTLIHLPRVFASFVQDQYMSIFAIALPYTNPFKFNQYTVSLAHHVIAMWFLKCRLSFRRGFVSYIIKGLEANVWAPFEEESKRTALEMRNEDSSNRQRSSSLTEQRRERRERSISGHQGAAQLTTAGGGHLGASRGGQLDHRQPVDRALWIFHQELTETCIDLMARYAFADCSALPTRFPSTNFLLSGGHSQTWMMDNKLITITTSGCTQRELRDGLCDKCWLICRKQKSDEEGKSGPESFQSHGTRSLKSFGNDSHNVNGSSSSLAERRRHRSAFAAGSHHRLSHNLNSDSSRDKDDGKAKDDLHLEHKLQLDTTGSDISMDENSTSPYHSELTLRSKGELFLCTCWCQGWAEVHIRRPTGNTSWMMRIQNHIGNYATSEIPIKELSSIFLQNVLDLSNTESIPSSPSSSALSSPTHHASSSLKSSPAASQELPAASSPTPAANTSPRTPDSPTDEVGPDGKKNPVRRSNSSPEMSSSWKPVMNRQGEIAEQDEEDASVTSSTEQEQSAEQIVNTNSTKSTEQESKEAVNNTSDASKLAVLNQSQHKGSTSPFRRSYDAIPEENIQHPRGLSRSPEATSDSFQPMRRDRVQTISVMTPVGRPQALRRLVSMGADPNFNKSTTGETSVRYGISPSFVFLQLCAQGFFGSGCKPLLLPANSTTERSLKLLDFITPYETHKIGVVYVGPGQVNDETAILQNQHGSTRYRDFLQGLGSLIKLREVDILKVYLGGLSKDGVDGEFASIWQDDVMQVIFHVATLMPNTPSDPNGNSKKRHIGNDFVAIVYNNSDEEYDISTIKGQFLYACIVIHPIDHRTNRVVVKAKPIVADYIGHTEPKIVSDRNLPILARQLALHANLASVIFQKKDSGAPYASNWLERLRNIKRLRTRLLQESGHGVPDDSDPLSTHKRPFNVDDFTEYV